MSAKKTDISQIRKYLNGELDAHAMHQLERAAQDDPFLMDALEGYENAAADQQPHLSDLDQRLQQRIGQSKVRRLIPWKYYAAAASVLIVFVLGYLLWPVNKPVANKNLVADKVQPLPPAADEPLQKPDTAPLMRPDNQNLIAEQTPTPAARSMVSQSKLKAAETMSADAKQAEIAPRASSRAAANAPVVKADTVTYAASAYKPARADTTPLSEVVVVGYGTQKKTTLTGSVSTITSQPLQGKLAGVQVTTPDHVSGRVMDEMGIPLPGVTVKVSGKSYGTVTDVNGRFSLTAKDKDLLDVNYIGYASKQIRARANDSLKIALSPTSNSLAEVVVTRSAQPVKPVKEAHPQMGWDEYNRYIKNRAIADDEKAGNVRLSFTVDAKGNLSDFKIIKGLSEGTNQQAIDLIKDGPNWLPDVDGKPKTIKLKIHFSKE